MKSQPVPDIKTALFDYGGVIAEEGFREGLKAIGRKHGKDEQSLVELGFHLVFDMGFVTGEAREEEFWNRFRHEANISDSDQNLRDEILHRFTPRQWMLDIVHTIREKGVTVAILSDQVHWLDELDDVYDFFSCFNYVFNSYHLGMSKKNPLIFDNVLHTMNSTPSTTLFIDDSPGNIRRGAQKGLHTILYTDKNTFISHLQNLNLL